MGYKKPQNKQTKMDKINKKATEKSKLTKTKSMKCGQPLKKLNKNENPKKLRATRRTLPCFLVVLLFAYVGFGGWGLRG